MKALQIFCEGPDIDRESLGETYDVQEAEISAPTLNIGDISAMQVCLLSQFLLGKSQFNAPFPDSLSKGFENALLPPSSHGSIVGLETMRVYRL